MENFPLWISAAGLVISLMTVGLSWVRFGREVHVDDKDRMLVQLAKCEKDCAEFEKKLDAAKLRIDKMESDYSTLREENFKLYRRLSNGGKPA